MHGLFGFKRNFRAVSQALARDLKRHVYAVDLRNHGESPHARHHTYPAMSDDVVGFIENLQLQNPTLIGHSMGAKVAMTLALTHPALLAYLIAVDNAPVESPLNHDFWTYMQGMTAIDTGHYTSRKDVDRVFSTYVSDPLVRHFLLANLTRVPSPDGPYRFQFPVLTLRKALVRLGKFPFHDPEATHFDKPALFIRGTRSHYVSDKVLPLTRRFFPNMQLVDIDCGHWVISEKPQPFMEAVKTFLREQESKSPKQE